jgi:hypothetical protein
MADAHASNTTKYPNPFKIDNKYTFTKETPVMTATTIPEKKAALEKQADGKFPNPYRMENKYGYSWEGPKGTTIGKTASNSATDMPEKNMPVVSPNQSEKNITEKDKSTEGSSNDPALVEGHTAADVSNPSC